jgi:cephalosporin-C deacetylase-like acetyl esterase
MKKSARAFSARRVHDRKKTVYIKQRVKQLTENVNIVAELTFESETPRDPTLGVFDDL